MRAIAEAGYLAAITPMPFGLAVLSPDAADGVIAEHPEIETWVIGGHSLGGAMAAQYADGHDDVIDGLVLWAAYPAGGTDLSDADLIVASISASEDGLASREEIEASAAQLPPDTTFVEIEGGNHAQFGSYGEQAGDGEATIPPAEQQDQAVAATLAVLEAVSARGVTTWRAVGPPRTAARSTSAGHAPHGVPERERQRTGVELDDLHLEAVLTRRQRMAGHVERHDLALAERDRRLPRYGRRLVDEFVAGAGRAHGGGVHDAPVHADPSDTHERAVSQAVAGLQSEAVTLVLEAAADVELADHEVGHAHPGSLAGRRRAACVAADTRSAGQRALPAGRPRAAQCVLP